jgi:hypothetical protein
MRIEPYESLGVAKFGESQSAVIAKLGKPDKETINRLKQIELSYPNAVYRFKDHGGLVESSIHYSAVQLNCVSVLFPALVGYLRENDKDTFEKAGFTVSPKFGIAIDPEYPSWITIFAKGQLALWKTI